MIYLAAPTVTRMGAAELAPRVRERFGSELRRAGTFAQLCLLGAQACLETAPRAASLGVLWASAYGAREAALAALGEAATGDPVMPFTFVATQPHLAATLLAQRSVPVSRAAFLHVDATGWPWLLQTAQAWLTSCEQVLLGWVEESAAGQAHQSDWCVLQKESGEVSCEAFRESPGALPATSADWLARVAAWLAAPHHGPITLRGDGEAWRFAAAR